MTADIARAAAGGEHPIHGVGSLGHGYVEGECDDRCNNGQCRAGELHDRCTPDCSAMPVWDLTGSPWAADAPNLQPPLLALGDWSPATADEYELQRRLQGFGLDDDDLR